MSTKQLSLCGETIKQAYEGQANTNAFTDAEQAKLSGIAPGAQVNAVTSVAGKTGSVTLVIADVASLQGALDGKSNTGHGHLSGDIDDFSQAVSDIADERIAAQKSLDGMFVFRGDNTGETDVTAALKSFIETADVMGGGKKVYIPDGRWLVNDLDPNSSVNVECSPNAVFVYNAGHSFLVTNNQAAYVAANTVGQDVSAITTEVAPDGFTGTADTDYVSVLQVADASGFAYGDILFIGSSNIHPSGGSRRMGEVKKVRWVDATTNKIYLTGILNQAAASYYTTDIFVRKYPTDRFFNWKGGKVQANGDWKDIHLDVVGNVHNHAFTVKNFPYADISDMEFDGLFEGAITLHCSPFYKVDNIKIRNGPNLRTQTTTLGASPLSTDTATNAGGNTTIVVTHAGHNFITGQRVNIAGASTTRGVLNTALNANHLITVLDANSYSFVVAGTASSSGTGGGSAVTSSLYGRLGYGIQALGHGSGTVTNIEGHELRHLLTTDGRGSASFNKVNWTSQGQPTNLVFDGIRSYGAYGIPIDTHEEGDGIFFRNIEVFFPMQGPQGGSYDGFGVHCRASNIRIQGYRQYGGYGGIRVQAVPTLIGSTHQFENIYVEATSESTSNDVGGIRQENMSGITAQNRTKVRAGRVVTRNCGRTLRVNGGGADIYIADLEATGIGVRAIQLDANNGAPNKVMCGRSLFDFTDDPRAQASQHICGLTGDDTVHLGDLSVIMGATTAETPRVFGTISGTTAGKKVGYSSLKFIDPSNVGKLEAYGYDNASEYTWIGGGDVLNLTLTDSGTAIAAGTSAASYVMPQRFQVIDLMAQVKTVSSSGAITLDVNKNGTSMMGTAKITIDENEASSLTAATPYGYDTSGSNSVSASPYSMLARGDTLSVDVDSAGTGAVGGLVSLRGFWC